MGSSPLEMGSPKGEAIKELVDRIRPRLFILGSRYRIPSKNVDDFLEETILRLISSGETISDPESWILLAFRNRCVAYWRREKARSLARLPKQAGISAAEAAVLKRGGFDLGPAEFGPNDPFKETSAELAAILRESLPVEAVAERLGMDPSRTRLRLMSVPRSLLGIPVDSGWMVPTFQLDGGGLLHGISDVVALLDPALHPVAVFRWFHLPNPDLVLETDAEESKTLSPRDWLQLGLPVDPVKALAAEV